ncbi:MAG: helix-turn-helix domain-containing protein [Oscillospiraceae bacterium]|jgi:transcriptional regulator with XRE-family HTH domain|nr:helix-turn-helix domain-containing protein [Oscillospiraceae bacterium]
MTLTISENIRRLRRARDMKQEDLAATLGVTPQTVSKWETNTGYPDLEMIPSIANFFGVTTDELLGVDVSRAKEKIQAYYDEIRSLNAQWKLAEMKELARRACREFPGNHMLQHQLAWAILQTRTTPEERAEGLAIAERVAEEATDINQKLEATMLVAYTHEGNGDKKAAREVAKRLPNVNFTQQALIRLEDDRDTELATARANIDLLFDNLAQQIESLAGRWSVRVDAADDPLTIEERIELYTQNIELQHIVYGDNLLFRHYNASEWHQIIVRLSMSLARHSDALDHLERAIYHAEKYAEYTTDDTYSSLMMLGVHPQHQSSWSDGPTLYLLDFDDAQYDALRDNLRFTALLDRARTAGMME